MKKTACGFNGDTTEIDYLLQQHQFFWSTAAKKKLHSPGRWPLSQLETVNILGGQKRLKALKWAFNAKPDFLLLSGGRGILIEAKAASPFSINHTTGYDQQEVQRLIADLFPVVTRGIVTEPLGLITLTNSDHKVPNRILWREVADAVDREDVGDFASQALTRASQVLG